MMQQKIPWIPAKSIAVLDKITGKETDLVAFSRQYEERISSIG